jgi:hypothetical protein
MPTYLVNSNTSVIPIKTNTLSTGEYALVYLPTTSNIGQLITIRDTFGYLSSPQAILVSTTGGASITGGVNPIRIQQGYGYVTLRSETVSNWSIIDQNAFSTPSQNYALRGITYGAINVIQTGFIINSVSSTGSYLGINSQVFSTLETVAPMFANSVGVNVFTPQSDTYFQNGSAFITGSTVMLSSLSLPGSASITGNANITGPMSLQSSMTVTGPFTFSTNTGRFTIQNTVSTNLRFYADNTISTGGQTSISSFARVQDNMYVSSLRTNAVFTNTVQTNEMVFSANIYIRNRPDITVASATYTDVKTPVIQMQDGIFQSTPINANTFVSDLNTIYYNTGTLNITSSINTPGVTQLYLNRAAIFNPSGSLTISSIATNNLTLSNITIFGGNPANRSTIPIVRTGNINTSSIYLSGGAIFPQTTTVNFVITNTCSTNNTVTSSLIYGDSALIVDALSLSTIFVNTREI